MAEPTTNPGRSAGEGYAILLAIALGIGNVGQYVYWTHSPAPPAAVTKDDPTPAPNPRPVVTPPPAPAAPQVQHVVIDNLPPFPAFPATQHVVVDSMPGPPPSPGPVVPPVPDGPVPAVPDQHLLVVVVYNPSTDPTSSSPIGAWKDDPTLRAEMSKLDATAMFLGSGDRAAAPLLPYVSGSTLILQTASGVAYHGPCPRSAGDLIAFIQRVRAGATK